MVYCRCGVAGRSPTPAGRWLVVPSNRSAPFSSLTVFFSLHAAAAAASAAARGVCRTPTARSGRVGGWAGSVHVIHFALAPTAGRRCWCSRTGAGPRPPWCLVPVGLLSFAVRVLAAGGAAAAAIIVARFARRHFFRRRRRLLLPGVLGLRLWCCCDFVCAVVVGRCE